MKKCSKCGIEKPLSEFVKHKNCKDGYENTCKICVKQYKKEYRENNKDKIKEYYRDNKDNLKKYYEENKDKIKEYNKKYYEKNKEKIIDNVKKYREENKEKLKESYKEYLKKKRKNDPIYRMMRNIRSMVRRAIKTKRTEEIIGCTYQELKLHLENQFTEAMSWENYGFNGWHIDHIRPLSWFDIANPDEVAKANHYSNLQPLWWEDNLSKGNRFAS